ncbi:MAG: MBL fold metallo-hydrolase [Spirochaetia bacterium]|jgi:glyoxylase-like metal-dependent hydrolase (beta-lactamase superfamily II)
MNGYYRFAVGSMACTSLLDGTHTYKWQDFFSNAPREEALAAMESKGVTGESIVTPYTYLYVDTGDHQILIDAGAGSLFPTTGLLSRSMAEAEIDPAEIDTVIITHAHPDHIGGLVLADGAPAFPNAAHYIWKREWDYWFSEEERSLARQGPMKVFDMFFDFARGHLSPVRQLVHLVEFSGEESAIYPGVTVFRAPGHTPGHMITQLSSGREKLLYIGDAVLSPLHLEHPAWLPIYDIEPEPAAVSKRFVFDYAASQDCLVVGQHFPPFPSLGRVSQRREGWEWRSLWLNGD